MKSKVIRLFTTLMLVLVACISTAVPALAVDYDSSLTLVNKDYTTWEEVSGACGLLQYCSSGPEFVWSLSATGLSDGEYSLIYYADYSGDRFGEWGGDNPGAVIATVTATTGAISDSGSIDLGMDLPCPPDANISEHDYSGEPDNYDNAYGAKIWLVPTSALSVGGLLPVTAWPPTSDWLFETDLITYDDTDVVTATVEVLADLIQISVDPTSLDFGQVHRGFSSDVVQVTVTNEGSVAAHVTATTTSVFYQDNLTLDSSLIADWSENIAYEGSATVPAQVHVPSNQDTGIETGVIVFWAEAVT